MKKLILLIIIAISFFSCSKDDNLFNYDKAVLIGTWRMTHMEADGSYYDVTVFPYNTVITPTYATFYSDGKYHGFGEFGTGDGTYTAIGKSVICYINGKEYMRYEVISLTNTNCELLMVIGNESTKIKCMKQ